MVIVVGFFYWKLLPWQHTSNVVIQFNRQKAKWKVDSERKRGVNDKI
jgi:hypothetical protein